jgi:hypothetical protein
MLLGFRPIYSSLSWRVAYVVCTLLVFSYILFDVLDLDGSNFPWVQVERTVIVAEIPSDMELIHVLDRAGNWENASVLCADRSREYAWVQRTEFPRSSPLDSARSHGYRVGLPRGNSVPDSSPFA